MRAASSSSMGIVRMCWVIRKMKNAEPKKAGTQRGFNVLYQWSPRQTMKPGIMVTWEGSMMVARRMRKATDRPGQWRRAKEYPTKEAEKSEPAVQRMTRRTELMMY